MPYIRRTSFPRNARSRPNRSWAISNNATFVGVGTASKLLLATLTPTNAGIDETIMRTVGMLAVATDQLAATENQIGAFGMIIVTDRAAAAGVASIPGPVTDGGDDGWFVYQPIVQQFGFGSAVGFDASLGQRYMVDSKAKRVLQNGEVVALVVENISAVHAFEIAFMLRILGQVRGTR